MKQTQIAADNILPRHPQDCRLRMIHDSNGISRMALPHVHRGWELKLESACDLVLIPPQTIHSSSFCLSSIEFSHRQITAVCPGQNTFFTLSLSDQQLKINGAPEIAELLNKLESTSGTDSLRKHLTVALIEQLQLLLSLPTPKTFANIDPYEIIHQFLHRNYYNHSLGVADIADFVGMSIQYLNVLLRKRGKLTLRQLLIDIRLTHAYELLQDGNRTVADVANLTGWNSPFYFCRCFKKKYAVAPSAIFKPSRNQE